MPPTITRKFPAARQVQKAYDQPDTLTWNSSAPPGKSLLALWVDANITTVGAGLTTAPLSQAIQELTAHDENERLVMDVDQYSLDLAAGVGKYWQKENIGYDLYRSNPAYLDPANGAAGASLYGRWILYTPLPGRAHAITAQIQSMKNVFGPVTAGPLSMSIVPIYIDSKYVTEQYTLYAKLVNATQKGFKSAFMAALFARVEWSTIQSGIDLGGKLSPEEIIRLQDFFDDAMGEYITISGSAANPDVKPLTDASTNPITDVFCLAKSFDVKQALISYGLTVQSVIKAIIYSDLPTDQIAINVST